MYSTVAKIISAEGLCILCNAKSENLKKDFYTVFQVSPYGITVSPLNNLSGSDPS